MVLSEEDKQKFVETGFLVVPDFVDADTVSLMRDEALSIVSVCSTDSISVFSTRNQTSKTDAYFLDSARRVSLFYEEGACLGGAEGEGVVVGDGGVQVPKEMAINKIGHGMCMCACACGVFLQ